MKNPKRRGKYIRFDHESLTSHGLYHGRIQQTFEDVDGTEIYFVEAATKMFFVHESMVR